MNRHLIARWSNPRFFFAAADDKSGSATPQAETPKDPANLTEAKAQLAAAREEAKGAREAKEATATQLAAAQAENARLTEQFATATQSAATAQAALATEQAAHTATKGQLTAETEKLTTANANVDRLEKLCGLSGVDPKHAVPQQAITAQTTGRDALLATLQAATDPVARGRAAAALRAYDLAQKTPATK